MSVHDRPSGFEATVAGRALETDGSPAADALVTLYERYPGWSGGWRILAQMNSDAKGDFAFADIDFSDASQVIDVRGGADFAVKVTPLSLVTCGHVDLGEVKLDPHFVLEGRFDGPLPGTRNWFQLLNPERGSIVRGVQLSEDRTFRLAGLRAGEYTMRVFSESRVNRQTTRVTYDARWTWDARTPTHLCRTRASTCARSIPIIRRPRHR